MRQPEETAHKLGIDAKRIMSNLRKGPPPQGPPCVWCEKRPRIIDGQNRLASHCGAKECLKHDEERRVRGAIDTIGIPKMYAGAELKQFPTTVWKAVKQIGWGESVFITGPNGVGKTHLAAALSKWWAAAGLFQAGKWIPCPYMLMELRSTFNNRAGQQTEMDIVTAYGQAPYLVLDDVGAEKVTDWTLSSLYVVLNTRIDRCLPTVVTSNLDLKDLDQLEPRIASRLAGFYPLTLTGRDRRMGTK